MYDLAVKNGVDPAVILIEDQSTSTFQNGLYSIRKMRQHDLKHAQNLWTCAVEKSDIGASHWIKAITLFQAGL